jgi:uncharacterized protein YkwD
MFKIAFLLIFFGLGCPVTIYAGTTNASNEDSVRQEVLTYVNQYRKEQHLPALQLNVNISQEASKHSQDMAAHRLPVGHDLFNQRIKRLRSLLPKTHAWAENVAYAYTEDAKEVVSGWMKSSGHRKNILGHYNFTGIGIARDKQGKLYYTQIFIYV